MQVVSKPSGETPDGYQKQINLDLLRLKEIVVLEKLINKLGYKNIYHFLENYTDWEKNYIAENIKLIKEYKFHNPQGYNRFINLGLQVAFHLFQEYKHSSTLKSFGVIVPTEQIAINLIQEFNLMLDELKKF